MRRRSTKIAIVGSGAMARERASSFRRLGAEVVCVFSRTPGKARALCRTTGAKAADSFDEVLHSSADAVIVCVPNSFHAEFALRALAAGKHVLVEYPLCTTCTDCDLLTNAATRARKVLMVGNTIIHEQMFAYLRQNNKRLGTVLSAASRVSLYDPGIVSAWYMTDDKRGGVFPGFHYHHIEYFRRLIGEILWVRGFRRAGVCPSVCGGELLMGHTGGATSCIHWYLCAAKSNRGLPRCLWINGSESSVTIVSVGPDTYEVVWDGGGRGKRERLREGFGIDASSKDFIRAIAGRLDFRKRLESDLRTLRVGFAAEQSSETGRRLDFHE
jgi:predicted dehydrogenase